MKREFASYMRLLPLVAVFVFVTPFSVYAQVDLDASSDSDVLAEAPLDLGVAFRQARSLTNSIVSSVVGTAGFSDTATVSASLENSIKTRAEYMQEFAQTNPEAFLANVLSQSIRDRIPARLQKYLEKEVDITGTLNVRHIDDFENHTNSRFMYSFLTENGTFDLTQAGSIQPILSGTKAKIRGYQISGRIVALPGQGGLTIQSTPTARSSDSVGNQRTLVILLYDATDTTIPPYSHADIKSIIFKSTLQKFYKDQSYGKVSFSGIVTDWIGIPSYPSGGSPCGLGSMEQIEIQDYLIAHAIDPTVYARTVFLIYSTGGGCSGVGKWTSYWQGKEYQTSYSWIGIPNAEIQYYTGYANGVQFVKRLVPEDVGFVRCVAYVIAHPTDTVKCLWGSRVIYDTTDPLNYEKNFFESHSYFIPVVAHELGHALGVMHANAWICGGISYYSSDCRHVEYGNSGDTMGRRTYGSGFNAFYRDSLGWIASSSKKIVRTSGKRTITPIETQTGVTVLEIQNPSLATSTAANKSVYVEMRAPIGFDYPLASASDWSGILVNQPIVPASGAYPFVRLLNAQQATVPDFSAPALHSGMRMSYPSHGISINNVSVSSATSTMTIALSTTTCKLFPMRTTSFGSDSIAPGGTILLAIGLTNRSYPACQESSVMFAGSNAHSLGWKIDHVYPTSPLSVPVADTQYYYVGVYVSTSTAPGSYSLVMAVKDTTYGKRYKYTFPITVTP